MSESIGYVLYLGDNIPLVDALFDSLTAGEKKTNYQVLHLMSATQLYRTLSEKSVSHLISELPLDADLKAKIKADFPLLKTTYLNAENLPRKTGLPLDPETIFTDEAKAILECLSIPIYFKNKQGQYLACNKHFSELFGLSPDQFIGKKLADISDSPLNDDIHRIDQQLLINQHVALHEYKWATKAGEERDFLFHKECLVKDQIQIGLIFDITELNKSKSLLEKERVMLRSTADVFQDMIFIKDLESRVLGCNKAFEEFVGYSEKEILGKNAYAFFPLDQAIDSIEEDQRIIRTSQVAIREVFTTDYNGELQFLEVKKVPLRDKHGNVQGVIAVGRNMGERVKLQKRLKISDTAFENGKENMFVTDNAGNIIAANKACCETTGYSKKELLSSPFSIFGNDQHENIETALRSTKSWQGDLTYRVKNGDNHFAWAEVYIVEHQELEAVSRIYSFVDLSDSKNVEPKIQFLSKYDPLTGVFNRIALFNRLEGAISRAIYHQVNMAVVIVNINDFKAINAQYGHNAADRVLQEIAVRLKNCVFEKDTVARFGGDEFVIIIDGVANEQDAAGVAQNIVAQFERSVEIDLLSIQLSATVGIALCPDDGIDADALLGNAGKAMQRGKSDYNKTQSQDILRPDQDKTTNSRQPADNSAYHFYTRKLTHHTRQQINFEQQLKQALQQEQFELYYQPQFDLAKRQLVAVEAVLYWKHPQRGKLHFDNFSSLAEQCGLAFPIALVTIRKAAIQAVIWQKAAINFGRIVITLTEEQLSHLSLAADLQTILLETKCARECLEFEVEEATFQSQRPFVYENLLNLSKMGMALCIDKFCEGSTLFRVLDQMAIDKFKMSKLDKESDYVGSVQRSVQDGVQALARSLGLTVVTGSLDTITDGTPVVSGKCYPAAQQPDSKVMSASAATFYLRCNKHK